MKAILSLILLLFGAQAFAVHPGPVRKPILLQVLAGEFSVSKAMTVLYGSYDETKQASPWRENRLGRFPVSWLGAPWVEKLLDSAYEEDGTRKRLLVTSARRFINGVRSDAFDSNTCHACGVVLGVAVFAQGADGWKVEASNLNLGQAGAWGLPPQDVTIQKIGDHMHGFVIHQSDMHQGEPSTYFVAYAPRGSQYVSVFSEYAEMAALDEVDEACYDRILASDKKRGKALATEMCRDPDEKVEFVPPANPDGKSHFYKLGLVRTYHGVKQTKPLDIVHWYSYDEKKKEYRPDPVADKQAGRGK